MDRSNNTSGVQPSMADIARMQDLLAQNQGSITAAMERHLSMLDPEDREVLRLSKEAFLNYASAGFWLGAFGGVAFAMRGRFATASTGGVPKLFYPALNGKSTALPKGRAFGFFKTLGSGVGGSLIGLQIGVWTGSRAGKKVLEQRPGVQQRATDAMTAAGEEVKAILEGTASSDSTISNSSSGMSGDGDASFYGENEFINEDGRSNTMAPRSVVGDATASKWAELRKSSASPPSTWERIRDQTGRDELPESQRRSRNDVDALPEPGSDEMYGQDREKERREFDAMLEKERRSAASSSSSGSGFNSDGTWRG